jgi:hypothetical protein
MTTKWGIPPLLISGLPISFRSLLLFLLSAKTKQVRFSHFPTERSDLVMGFAHLTAARYVTFTFAKPKVKRTLAEQPEARSVTFTFACGKS